MKSNLKGLIICSILIISVFVSGKPFMNSNITNYKSNKDFSKNSFVFGEIPMDSLDTLKVGVFTDERDGKQYEWVQIGDQVWMAQNLAFKADSGCSPFRGQKKKAEKEGYLYDWETAQKVAPKGWHLASEEEYRKLISYIGGTDQYDAYKYLVGGDKYGMHFKRNGKYWSNFPKQGKGRYIGGTFHPVKTTKLWTSTFGLTYRNADTLYSTFDIRYGHKIVWLGRFNDDKLDRYPVRCIKD
jgi:uncharacterized protein (TIGR02145 family)